MRLLAGRGFRCVLSHVVGAFRQYFHMFCQNNICGRFQGDPEMIKLIAEHQDECAGKFMSLLTMLHAGVCRPELFYRFVRLLSQPPTADPIAAKISDTEGRSVSQPPEKTIA